MTDPFQDLTAMARHVYNVAKSKGWHDDAVSLDTYVSNLHGEVSELWEAYRTNKLGEPCGKDCGLNCLEEELADIIIRALDMAHDYGVNITHAVRAKSAYNESRPYRHGGKKA